MAQASKKQDTRDAFIRLQEESKRNVVEITGLVEYLEGLDKARIKRIDLLKSL
jgi:cbb3-type cytochrome oxidase cytochrome c subunit